MRKLFSLQPLLIILLVAATAHADTITLKNGSVIKGKVASFADEQFVILLNTGSGYRSKAMIYMSDIAKIDFDSAAGTSETANGGTTSAPEENTIASNPAPVTEKPVKETSTRETPTKNSKNNSSSITPPVPNRNSKKTEQPKEPQREEVIDTTPTEKPTQPEVTTADPPKVESKKAAANVKTQTVEIGPKRDWSSTGLIVKKGDRIRITATGSMTLDAAGESSGPEGIDTPDSRKLMADKPTGGLIGVIGADNDDFFFIGRAAEFTATREGLLFLSVNEGTLSDNSGSYKAVIEIQPASRPTRQ
jgi:hypothetical protein